MTDDQKYQYEKLIAARNYHYDNLNKWLMSFYVIIGALFMDIGISADLCNFGTFTSFIIVCIALMVVVLMQESKDSGLGSLSGEVDTYVRKNRGRTREGQLVRITTILGVLFFVLAIALDLKFLP